MNHLAPRPWTLLVTHPDPLLRAGLVAALRQHAAFEVFVDGVDAEAPDRTRIDVVITDYDDAMALARSLHPARDRRVSARILVLTTIDREADIRRAIEAGVHGYIVLGGPLDELIDGLTTVAHGLRYVSRSVAQRMADSLGHTSLTSREMEVLSLVAGGESNKAIARDLEIKTGTVKSHMTAIMTKLGARSRTQAASIAATRGLVGQRDTLRPMTTQRPAGVLGACMSLSPELLEALSWPVSWCAVATQACAALV
ncbi:response regulator transcription factor [Variovorax sp. J22R133]|uniref:LuxR C-terminal-related transcriptional regulator n=1 Tax=Variovorax brevis TaxID=3053503 RepID=UPI002578FB9A|nr:response regulator transcription factor [Variovorax sp. J22R133]MDM0115973.1 response regulator transcription factor [Variovorax sp. J22R133]